VYYQQAGESRKSPNFLLFFLDLLPLFLVPFLTDKLIHWVRLEVYMNDLIYIGLTILFFALTYGLIVVCERLMEDKS
jgi:hypothetical protein